MHPIISIHPPAHPSTNLPNHPSNNNTTTLQTTRACGRLIHAGGSTNHQHTHLTNHASNHIHTSTSPSIHQLTQSPIQQQHHNTTNNPSLREINPRRRLHKSSTHTPNQPCIQSYPYIHQPIHPPTYPFTHPTTTPQHYKQPEL